MTIVKFVVYLIAGLLVYGVTAALFIIVSIWLDSKIYGLVAALAYFALWINVYKQGGKHE